MEARNIKDFIHLYLGCEVMGIHPTDDSERKGYLTGIHGEYEAEIQFFNEDGFNVSEEPEYNRFNKVKPILRPLSDMTEEDFRSLFKYPSVFHIGKSHWHGAILDDLDIDRVKDMNDEQKLDLLAEYEEAGLENVLTYTTYTHGFSHGGLDEEMFYGIYVEEYSSIINDLRKMGFDCDGLIKSGLAIDKTKVYG